jgi:hypothetical protein
MMARLPPPLFVEPQDVILRMQLDKDLAGIEDVIRSGIIAAQLHVERVIDGHLARRSQKCGFFIDAEAFSGIAPGGLYRLEIPSGLVRQDVPQVVTASYGAVNGPFSDSYADVNTGLMQFDYNRGYLYVDAATYGNHHIKIQCDTGFEDGTKPLPVEGLTEWSATEQYHVGDIVAYSSVAYRCTLEPPVGTSPLSGMYWTPATVPQEPIPDAIYEAIVALVPMVFNANQTTNRSDEAKNQYQVLTDHANLLLQPYTRTQGFTFRSI